MGDVVSVALINGWLALYPHAAAINAYGPTEASDDIMENVVGAPLPADQTAVPIGRPLANLSLYLLDARRRLVPTGVPGELYVAGIGVGEGYFDDPAKTAAAFFDSPFDPARPRMYRTGDIAQYLPDGQVHFLGRIDHQVKIRGFRVELGEIEAALLAQPAVLETVVVARPDALGDKRLVAYVVAREGAAPVASELRAHLVAALPDYMVPAAVVVLDAMPLTPNGKLDRGALPAPDDRAIASRPYAAPQGELEAALADIWQVLLGVARVGRDDHFFEIGGHSLFAVQLVARIRQVFKVDLPLREVFAQPTLAALAVQVMALQTAQYAAADVERLAREIDRLSEDEIRQLLAQEGEAG